MFFDRNRISVRRACWSRDGAALRWIRSRVFVEEQGVPAKMEWDGLDDSAIHLIAEDRNGEPIGTARVLATGQIGRMAVLPGWRHRGAGSMLLTETLRIAMTERLPNPWLHAQIGACPFYRRHHFTPVGSEFYEAGIAHRRMVYAGQWRLPAGKP